MSVSYTSLSFSEVKRRNLSEGFLDNFELKMEFSEVVEDCKVAAEEDLLRDV